MSAPVSSGCYNKNTVAGEAQIQTCIFPSSGCQVQGQGADRQMSEEGTLSTLSSHRLLAVNSQGHERELAT